MTYPTISLFSGAMGLDLGLEAAGLDIKIMQDIDQWCVKTMEANKYRCVHGDIKQLITEDPKCNFLLKPAGLYPGEAFAVVGGPPCQPFSTAGNRLGTNDPRGSLFMDFYNVIKVVKPRFFVMENVKGLLSSAIRHIPLKDRNNSTLAPDEMPGSVFNIIKETFNSLGYKLVYGILDAAHYGVPQFRERLVIIGSRDQEDIFLPMPTHYQLHQDPSYRWCTLRDAIGDLEDDPGPVATFSADRLKLLKMVPMGGNWRNLPPELISQAMGGAYKSGGGKVGFYRRLDYEQPCPTLVTSPVQKATMLCHPTKDRPLSVREYARIQQFPDNWEFVGKVTDCYRQIGNAVPIGLGKAVGQVLIAVANGNAKIQTRRLRGTSVHESLQRIQNIAIKAAK
ncbi:MAG: DNA cytosine methyltransferase [Clostridiales bacterium]|jgi:DNA (cytosine-5)-methyltransferase 1|nr:DNA cytosine methyltransferase [Clostridiales bacterium]